MDLLEDVGKMCIFAFGLSLDTCKMVSYGLFPELDGDMQARQ